MSDCCPQCPSCAHRFRPTTPKDPGPNGIVHRCGRCGQAWGHARWPMQDRQMPVHLQAWLTDRAIPLD